jgi:hypothetical protein
MTFKFYKEKPYLLTPQEDEFDQEKYVELLRDLEERKPINRMRHRRCRTQAYIDAGAKENMATGRKERVVCVPNAARGD